MIQNLGAFQQQLANALKQPTTTAVQPGMGAAMQLPQVQQAMQAQQAQQAGQAQQAQQYQQAGQAQQAQQAQQMMHAQQAMQAQQAQQFQQGQQMQQARAGGMIGAPPPGGLTMGGQPGQPMPNFPTGNPSLQYNPPQAAAAPAQGTPQVGARINPQSWYQVGRS